MTIPVISDTSRALLPVCKNCGAARLSTSGDHSICENCGTDNTKNDSTSDSFVWDVLWTDGGRYRK